MKEIKLNLHTFWPHLFDFMCNPFAVYSKYNGNHILGFYGPAICYFQASLPLLARLTRVLLSYFGWKVKRKFYIWVWKKNGRSY